MSDNDILGFIERHHIEQGSTSPTALLRLLRNSNLACEQSRFSRLFQEWQASQRVIENV